MSDLKEKIEEQFPKYKAKVREKLKLEENVNKSIKEILEDIICNDLNINKENLNKSINDLGLRAEMIVEEDIGLIIKKYPRVAIEKSIVLKALYTTFEKCNWKDVYDFAKEENNTFYRGRLFDEGESPYLFNEPYKEIVQPPELYASEGRFNEKNQSRFYLTNKKIGAYFECRKHLLENKNKELYVQEFRCIKNPVNNLNIAFFNQIFGIKFTRVPTTLYDVAKVKVRELHLNEDYGFSNYLADIVNATSKYKGISYYSSIFYNCFKHEYGSYIQLEEEKIYKNITVFSRTWDNADSELNLTDGEFEAKDYFEPIKTYPVKLEPKEVILSFFKEGYLKIDNNEINLKYGVSDDIEFAIKLNFEKLFENLNTELTGVREILKIEINDSSLGITEENWIRTFESFNERTNCYKNKFKNEFEKLDIEINTKGYNKKELEKDFSIRNFKFYFNIETRNDKNYLSVKKVELSKKAYIRIINEIIEFFNKYFGIYYRIVIDFENDLVMLAGV